MTTDNVFKEIRDLDLSVIKTKLMHAASGEGWSAAKADAVELEYKRFLHLMKKFPTEQTAPQVDVDTFWHYHILDTMKYAADCAQAFGYFLHHYPYIGMEGAEDDQQVHQAAGARMQELYEATFGEIYAPAAQADAAYCGRAPAASTAYCGRAPAASTAYCGRAPAASTAYCGRAPAASTAYCGRAPAAGTAYCGATSSAKAAYCGATASPKTACYGAPPSAEAAYCGLPPAARTVSYCGLPPASTAGATAYCGLPPSAATAYCGAPPAAVGTARKKLHD